MLSYQAGMAKFDSADTQVFGISEDFTPSQKEFAEKNKLTFPLLSDFSKRQVAKDYGVLIPEMGIANRATFVIDTAPAVPERIRGNAGESATPRSGDEASAFLATSARERNPSSVDLTPGVPDSMKSCASKCERVASGLPTA